MSRRTENVSFSCEYCGAAVEPLNNGSYRNHCPFCLHSKHVDVFPGDRKSDCQGFMEPAGLKYHPKKGWQIIHLCTRCRHKQANIVATDTAQPDDLGLLASLSQRVAR